jgi:3-oxoacyl-[acyl-carrier protein] reductase
VEPGSALRLRRAYGPFADPSQCKCVVSGAAITVADEPKGLFRAERLGDAEVRAECRDQAGTLLDSASVIVHVKHLERASVLPAVAMVAQGGDAVLVRADFAEMGAADFDAVQKAGDQILADFSRCDILVNNAGITRDTLAMRMSSDDWDVVLQTNLKGAFNFTRAILRAMVKQRSGRIINISSVSGLMGLAGQANYAASKAGLIGMTKSIAREIASRGITVNVVAPGFIETDMTSVLNEEVRKGALAQIPVSRFGSVDDIASAVAFLSSAEAGYISGQVLAVDGGMSM